jgi:hypothetical protein
MCVQWWVPVDPGVALPAAVPGEADEDGDGDELGDDVEDVVDVVVAAAEPLVEASATPVAPAPIPAARTPVRMSRRARRPPMVETMRFSLRDGRRDRERLVFRDQRASAGCPAAETRLSGRYERALAALRPGRAGGAQAEPSVPQANGCTAARLRRCAADGS